MAKKSHYGIHLGAREMQTLSHEACLHPGSVVAGAKLLATTTERDGLRYAVFATKHEATSFAIWAAGWIAATWKDGVVPVVGEPVNLPD